MYYYHRMRDIREDSDISQGQLAEYLQIKQTQLSRYERGINEIPLHYLIAIADYFAVSLDWITERTNKKEINRAQNAD